MSFYRFTAGWTGPGGPGVSHLDVRGLPGPFLDPADLNDIGAAWRAYFVTLAGYLPNEWQIGLSAEVQQLTDAGVLEDLSNITTAGGSVAGTYSGSWAGAVGVVTRFNTDSVVGGRRVRGKTYFVPAGSTVAFDQDGTLNSTALGDFLNARITLHNAIATNLGVPVVFSPTHGAIYDISGFNIADRSAVLRSRRD
jgi:hypothetical protein